ncbi:hypothetical protein ACLKA7_014963 [Drosophila subpalustris]
MCDAIQDYTWLGPSRYQTTAAQQPSIPEETWSLCCLLENKNHTQPRHVTSTAQKRAAILRFVAAAAIIINMASKRRKKRKSQNDVCDICFCFCANFRCVASNRVRAVISVYPPPSGFLTPRPRTPGSSFFFDGSLTILIAARWLSNWWQLLLSDVGQVCPSTGNQLSFSSIICHACLLPGYVLVTLNGCYCCHPWPRRQPEVGDTARTAIQTDSVAVEEPCLMPSSSWIYWPNWLPAFAYRELQIFVECNA